MNLLTFPEIDCFKNILNIIFHKVSVNCPHKNSNVLRYIVIQKNKSAK